MSWEVPSPQTVGRQRYVFGRWNDDDGPWGLNDFGSRRTVMADREATWFEANFVEQRRFEACADPADAGTVTIRPRSPDGFYTVKTPVEIEANSPVLLADSHEFMKWKSHGLSWWRRGAVVKSRY